MTVLNMSVRYSSPLNGTWWSDLGWVMVYVHSPTGAMPSLVARGGSRFSSCKYFRGKWTRSPRTPFSSCRAWSRSVSHRRSLLEFSFSSCTFLTPSRGRQLKTWDQQEDKQEDKRLVNFQDSKNTFCLNGFKCFKTNLTSQYFYI